MGLREKAVHFRRSLVTDRIGSLEDFYDGKTLTRRELIDIRKEFEKKADEVRAELDRRLIDMRTLFEVGKELNSSLDTGSLIQTVLFTVMGQFRLSDIAVFLFSGDRLVLSDKKGFTDLPALPANDGWIGWIAGNDRFIPVADLSGYPRLLGILEKSGAAAIVPFKNKDKLIGMLLLGSKPVQPADSSAERNFTEEEKEFCSTMASLSGIAIDNARLYEELKKTVSRLDKKLAELSTLYEISKVINSSDEQELVLELLTETVTTGFGVKKCALFVLNNGKAVLRKTVGLPAGFQGKEIEILPGEQLLLDENKTSVLEENARPKFFGEAVDPYLFVPLAGPKTAIGGLIIFSMDNYAIQAGNAELTGLFSIIASQAAPQIAMTAQVLENKRLRTDPFTPLLETMTREIERAKQFGVGVMFAMLHLKNYSKYIDLHGAEEASERFDRMNGAIVKILPENSQTVRYSSNRMMYILPGMIGGDFDDLKDMVLRAALDSFKDKKQIDIGADMLQCAYPESGDQALSLLNLIE